MKTLKKDKVGGVGRKIRVRLVLVITHYSPMVLGKIFNCNNSLFIDFIGVQSNFRFSSTLKNAFLKNRGKNDLGGNSNRVWRERNAV